MQFFNERDSMGLDIRVLPIVLTVAQIVEFDLPSAPDSDKVELDALEALHPGELHDIVTNWIVKYKDSGISKEARARIDELEKITRKANDAALKDHSPGWDALEAEYDSLSKSFESEFQSISKRRDKAQEEIQKALSEAAKGLTGASRKHSFQPIPRNREREGALFDSLRDYWTQNEHYQKRKADKPE